MAKCLLAVNGSRWQESVLTGGRQSGGFVNSAVSSRLGGVTTQTLTKIRKWTQLFVRVPLQICCTETVKGWNFWTMDFGTIKHLT